MVEIRQLPKLIFHFWRLNTGIDSLLDQFQNLVSKSTSFIPWWQLAFAFFVEETYCGNLADAYPKYLKTWRFIHPCDSL